MNSNKKQLIFGSSLLVLLALIQITLMLTGPSPQPASADGTLPALGADLEVTQADSADPVAAGDNVTYTVNVTNNGPETAEDVELISFIPLLTLIQRLQ